MNLSFPVAAYSWLLFVHFLALVVWLGPSMGGTYLYLKARRTGKRELIMWSLRESLVLYNLEHLAFAVVVVSGLGMLAASGWGLLAAGWFRWKLAFIIGLILPVEAWDVVVVNRVLAGVIRRWERGIATPEELTKALRSHNLVLIAGGVLFSIGVIAAAIFATVKP